ncbi:MAG: PQQ-binding-like beta-propeller repeat protein [Phycisphaerae bacterium]
MKRMAVLAVLCSVCAASTEAVGQTKDAERYWPQWRGPAGTGVAPHGNPPTEWSESKNIKWKTEIPGVGHASPIVWGDMIFVQTAIETERKGDPEQYANLRGSGRRGGRGGPGARGGRGERGERGQRGGRRRGGRGGFGMGGATPEQINEFVVVAVDRKTGKTLWKTRVCEKLPHEGGHADATQASNSPVTDGEHLYAFFGSRGLYCLDMKGKVIWKKDLGLMQTAMGFGEGVSPALYEDTLSVNRPILSCVNAKTGEKYYNKQRLEGLDGAYASIVGAKDRVYVAGRNGTTAVLRHGSKFELLATNKLDDRIDASPAIVGNELFLRGWKHLYCIAE